MFSLLGARFLDRSWIVGSAVGLALLGGACASAGVANTPPTAVPTTTPTAVPVIAASPVATNVVGIASFAFAPGAIAVPVGTTVTWTNHDVEQHTVTARDKSFNSDVIAGDKGFSFTFTKAGSYEYFCQIHPNMVGTVTVR